MVDDEELAIVSVGGVDEWSSYSAYARVFFNTGPGHFGIRFYGTDTDYYTAQLDIDLNRLRLIKYVAGAPTVLVTFDFGTIPSTLSTVEWYGLRVTAIPEGSDLRIVVNVDGDERISYLDTSSPHTAGGIALKQRDGTLTDVDEVEAFALPIESDEVGINPT